MYTLKIRVPLPLCDEHQNNTPSHTTTFFYSFLKLHLCPSPLHHHSPPTQILKKLLRTKEEHSSFRNAEYTRVNFSAARAALSSALPHFSSDVLLFLSFSLSFSIPLSGRGAPGLFSRFCARRAAKNPRVFPARRR